MKKQRIALFHPWIKSRGGAEKVVLELLANSKHNIDLYTWVYDKENTFEEFKKFNIKVIAPKIAQKISRLHILRGLFLPIALFKKINLSNYDKFLISTSGVAEFITFRNKIKGNTYAYSHTPLRDASKKIVKWNLKNRYKKCLIKKILYLISVGVYRFFEKIAWKNLDFVIFNSELSRSRAKERNLIKNKNTSIIYPPIKLPKRQANNKNENYFLYVSRINTPKRQKELVLAFKKILVEYPNFRLILVGTPDNKKYFENVKRESENNKNIEIKSNLTNLELDKLYANCKAGIFLGYQEDFGIVPIEVIGRGKPLIAPNEGGYVDLIRNNPLFIPIKEKHDSENMEKEIYVGLIRFMKNGDKSKKVERLEIGDFIKEIDEVLK